MHSIFLKKLYFCNQLDFFLDIKRSGQWNVEDSFQKYLE